MVDEVPSVDIECKWAGTVFWMPGCTTDLTVRDLKEIASDQILVPVERIRLIGLKAEDTGRAAHDDTLLGALRVTRPAEGTQPAAISCICLGTPDDELLTPPAAGGMLINDLDEDVDTDGHMSSFERILRAGRLPAPYCNLELVWYDDFSVDGPPCPDRWEFQTDCNDWIHLPAHGELQHYTSQAAGNAFVRGGVLVVEARREACEGQAYTSARLRTRGRGDWRYGRVEVCAKLPPGKRGLWPAIWMLPTKSVFGPWPASGEIDIMEQVGFEPGALYGSVHTAARNHRKGNHSRRKTSCADGDKAFHIYALEWEPTELRFFLDDRCFMRVRRQSQGVSPAHETWPFDESFHLVLNVAVGGRWAGRYGVDDSAFPARMEVKFVKVFQLPRDTSDGAPET